MSIDPDDFELKLEITEKCNSKCTFCHQNFGNRGSKEQMPFSKAAFWIQWAKDQKISVIRLTGGEPMLHRDLLKICTFASSLGLQVTVNSNGYAKKESYRRLHPFVKVLKISLPLILSDKLTNITGVKGSLQKKLNAVINALDIGFEVEILTVMLTDNIDVIEEYVLFVKDIPSLSWVPLRLESSSSDLNPLSPDVIQTIAESWLYLMNKYPNHMPKLRLATPFCAVDPIELGAQVFTGRRQDCGPFKSLTIDVAGRLIACYSCRVPFQKTSSLAEVSSDPEYLRLTRTDDLPHKCLKCCYLDICMGGCVSPHALVTYQGKKIDYLATFNNE